MSEEVAFLCSICFNPVTRVTAKSMKMGAQYMDNATRSDCSTCLQKRMRAPSRDGGTLETQ